MEKGKENKTITQQIEAIAEDFCNNYCKWPHLWKEEDGELSESEVCQHCPIGRL